MLTRRRGRYVALAFLALAAGCSSSAAKPTVNPTSTGLATDRQVANAQGGAVAEVPQVVAPGTGSSASAGQAASYAYVSETNRLVFLDQANRQLAPHVQLSAVPHEIAVAGDKLIVGFASGDLAIVDVVMRRQVARASLSGLRAKALGGDVILDELRVSPAGVLIVAGRIADRETTDYRSFIQERDSGDLVLKRQEILPLRLGVIQDLAFDETGAAILLLSDGGIYDLHKRQTVDAGAGASGQVLRYGRTGGRWIGSGGTRPGVLTPTADFIPLAAGRVTEIVPVAADRAAVLTSQPAQVLLVSADGVVLSKIDVDDYPTAAAIFGERLHVGSADGDTLQIVNLKTSRVERRLLLGQGIVSVGAFF